MENFKEIAEKCLAGELSGTFVTAFDNNWHSSYLQRYTVLGNEIPGQYILGPGVIYNEIGQCNSREEVRIIDFIPDNMKEQIKIDIPEGMKAVQETIDGEIRIKFVKKELTYEDICNTLDPTLQIHNFSCPVTNNENFNFVKKVEVLRKLTNIRNYFGKPDGTENGFYIYKFSEKEFKVVTTGYPAIYANDIVAFAKREHAEQAIKMLGDELKYLFEPW